MAAFGDYRPRPTGNPSLTVGTTPVRGPEEYLIAENNALRDAGCDLAVAALRVIRDHDGTHRLALAVAAWAQAVANEGGRPHEEVEP